jgi:hypothetical protein
MDVVAAAAGLAGILAFLYVVFVGQKTVFEWWRDRRAPYKLGLEVEQEAEEKITGVAHNLPQPDYEQFVDRDRELDEVMRQLRPYPYSQHAVVTIDGIGGVGKSSLALEVGYRYLRAYQTLPPEERFEAIVWCSAKEQLLTGEGIVGRGQALHTLDEIYAAIAITLHQQDIIRASRAEQHELVRSALMQQRTLLIIDNLETIGDGNVLAFLRELPAPTRAIVTTRHQIDVAYPVRLSGMDWVAAHDVISRECEKKQVSLIEEEEKSLFKKTGGVPLAAVWSIGQVAHGYSLETVLQRLGQPGDDVARFCFEGAIGQIKGSEAHRTLMALCFFATDASHEALGSVASTRDDALGRDEAIATLQRLSLINRYDGRFGMLPLTRTFVQTELAKDESFASEAKERLFAYMTNLVRTRVGTGYWDPITHWLDSDVLDVELENLWQCVNWAVEADKQEVVLCVGGALAHHLWRVGRSEDRRRLCERAVFAAQQLGDYQWEVWLLIDGLGYIYLYRQEMTKAEAVISQGKLTAEKHNFPEGEALALAYLAHIAALQGDFIRAKECLAATEGKSKMPAVLARIKSVEGLVALLLEDWPAAEKHYRDAIYYRRQCDGYQPPTQLALLGLVQSYQNKHSEAKATLEEALRHKKQTLEGIGYAKFGLAIIKAAEGDRESAQTLAEEALANMRHMRAERQITQIQQFLYTVEESR